MEGISLAGRSNALSFMVPYVSPPTPYISSPLSLYLTPAPYIPPPSNDYCMKTDLRRIDDASVSWADSELHMHSSNTDLIFGSGTSVLHLAV